ncbi:hypothetical protein ACS0TY_014779 [Phlomoides rotata]
MELWNSLSELQIGKNVLEEESHRFHHHHPTFTITTVTQLYEVKRTLSPWKVSPSKASSYVRTQSRQMNELVGISDVVCKNNLRMDRNSFQRLCYLLHDICGLQNSRSVKVQEKVAIFLSILAHHSKNMSLKYQFKRWGQTISKHFHSILRSVLKLHSLLLSEPQPVPEDSTDTRWGCFKVTVNVLGMCDMNMNFIYVLTGCDGSAADSRVLRDAINRPHGLRVPKGNYLCDNRYPNCEGFLTLYKGVRYHLNGWSSRRPRNYQEYLNMKHTRARNVIERTSVYSKCDGESCVAHHGTRSRFITKKEMATDPLECGLD